MNNWFGVSKTNPVAVDIYSRHYSSKQNGRGISDWLKHGITPPGESMTLLTSMGDALFVWNRQKFSKDDQKGVCCTVFRNEGTNLSSSLIRQAEDIARGKWPGERLYTYIDDRKIASDNPGYCFKQAGWKLVRDRNGKPKRTSRRGYLIMEKEIGHE